MTDVQKFQGVIIVESLEDASVLEKVRTIETVVEPVTDV